MTDEPIEADLAILQAFATSAALLPADAAALSRLLDYVEGMRWRPIESAPSSPCAVMLLMPHYDDVIVDAVWTEQRVLSEQIERAWFDGKGWYFAYTGHNVFESGNDRPLAWAPVLPPPPVKGGGE